MMWYRYSALAATVILAGCAGQLLPHTNASNATAPHTQEGSSVFYNEYYNDNTLNEASSFSQAAPERTNRQRVLAPVPVRQEVRPISSKYASTYSPGNNMVRVEPGQCMVYAQIKPRPSVHAIEVTIKDSSNKIRVTPAQLKRGYQQVETREGVITYKIEPATFKQVTEEVMIKPEVTKVEVLPALYEKKTERIKIQDRQTVLEPCQAAGSRYAKGTSVSAFCAKEIPAQYKTVEVEELVRGERTMTYTEPAEYKTVTRWVVDQPARAIEVQEQAEIEQLMVQHIVRDTQIFEDQTPAQTKALSVTEYEGEPQIVVRRAVCDNELSRDLVIQVQKKLAQAGYNPGPIDGLVGKRTIASLADYQLQHRLAIGAFTYETLEEMGIQP